MMNNLPLQPLVWTDTLTTTTIFRTYKVRLDVKGRFSVYYESSTGKPATGFISVDDAKHWAEFTHYASEMQPYVKPIPTKVYELTYDCGDSYSTLFMTLDKQQAVGFMESVKDADLDFIASYGIDCAADELLIEQYDDSHPLKPYKNEVFNSIYEDSFSEWALAYGGSSFVSSLDIIEHELLTSKKGD